MSNLEELIEKLCPYGVEYKKIGELVDYEQPGNYIVSSTKYSDEYNIPVLTAGQTFILGYINETDGVYKSSKDNPVIIFDDFTAAFKWVDFEFKVKSSAIKILTVNNTLTTIRYIYHVMGFLNISSDEHKRLWIGTYSNIKVPVPPLEVQREIVRILDNFTFLTTELAAELAARQKQYEYYKEYLFENHIFDVEWKRLDELFPFIRNGFVGTIKSFFTNETDGIRYLEGTNIHDGVISDNEVLYVTKEFHKKHIKNQLKSDDILMVQSGHIGECAVVGKKYEGSNCHALIIMSNGGKCLSKYYVYYFHTIKGFKSLTPAITGGTIKHVLAGKVGKIKVPVPSLEQQQRIVDILDRFDTLCNDISSGLPAEIEARQKQYEYYRDKLLTFKELKKEA
ncbi:restriction endonuclease subunit S [Phascolarctobacterium succinatutens]|uniref:restriction endonuclease subunit S n=1 Tax=Phascolarctobacterium succinatutens TaxID=626940 RepID=UPI00307E9D2D